MMSRMDIELTQLIRAALMQDERLSEYPINVLVVNGVATLTGTVQSYRRKLAAVEITESIHGCRGVIDKLVVEPPGQISDIEIAENVRSALDAHADITKKVIAVSVSRATVTLQGNIGSQWERTIAENVALSARGVRKVQSLLFVEPSLKIEDKKLARSIEEALFHTSGPQNTDLSVAIVGMTAVLSGHVPELWQKRKAEQVLKRFPVVLTRNKIIVNDS